MVRQALLQDTAYTLRRARDVVPVVCIRFFSEFVNDIALFCDSLHI